MDSSEDYPQLGERQGDQVLVCHGDDSPQEFAGWLYPLVEEFRKLELKAAEFGVDMDPEDESPPVAGVTDFCERLGIHFIKNMWEGSLVRLLSALYSLKICANFSPSAHAEGFS